MIFYTFIIVLSGTLAWWAQKLSYKLISRTRITVQDIFLNYFTYILIVLSALPYFFTMTFRYGIGTDYFITYYPTFVSASNPSIWHPHVETLYLFINNLVASFTNQFAVMLAITAAWIVTFFWLGIWKLSPIPWYSVILFGALRHYFISMNGIRQYMGLAVVFFAFCFIKEKGWGGFVKYTLCILLGAMFHRSTLLFFPLYFLKFLVITPKIAVVLLTVGSALNTPMRWFLRVILNLTPYKGHIGSTFDRAIRVIPHDFLLCLCIVLIGLFGYHECKKEPLFRFLFNLSLLAFFLSFNANLIPQSDRIEWSLSIGNMLIVPIVLSKINSRQVRVAAEIGLLLLFGAYIYERIILSGDHQVYPYESILWMGHKFF